MAQGIAVLALLVGAAWLLRPGTHVRRRTLRPAGRGPAGWVSGPALGGAAEVFRSGPARRWSAWHRHRLQRGFRGARRRTAPSGDPQFGRVLVEVAARLRAGAAVEQAWQQALTVEFGDWVGPAAGSWSSVAATEDQLQTHPDGVPATLAALHDQFTGQARSGGWRLSHRDRDVLARQVAGAVVACRVAHQAGAPLADLLHRCAQGLVEAGEADAARRHALAGPRATARLLGWLPVAGVGLGWAWGADPVGVLLGGGWGGLCLVVGVALMVAGRAWVNRLVRAAQEAGR